jgi:hypothetical protein
VLEENQLLDSAATGIAAGFLLRVGSCLRDCEGGIIVDDSVSHTESKSERLSGQEEVRGLTETSQNQIRKLYVCYLPLSLPRVKGTSVPVISGRRVCDAVEYKDRNTCTYNFMRHKSPAVIMTVCVISACRAC